MPINNTPMPANDEMARWQRDLQTGGGNSGGDDDDDCSLFILKLAFLLPVLSLIAEQVL